MQTAVVAALAGAILVVPLAAFAKSAGRLVATVNADGTASLTDEAGVPPADIPSTVYFVDVRDDSSVRGFRLVGPDVDRSTGAAFVGTVRWVVGFRWKERYRYGSDDQLRGTFTTDGGPPLVATLGRSGRVSLRTDEGAEVRQLRAGRYWILVRDRSRSRSVHLRGPGVNRSTTTRFRGEVMWIVTLRRGTYRFAPAGVLRVT